MIVIDMGGPDRILYVFTHGRVQSPILWDVLSLTTYLAGSLLYLYVPMIPDVAILRDRGAAGSPMRAWCRRLYTILALGWRGTPEQHRLLHRAIAVLAVVIIPVAISIHTVTAWLFGMTLRPGWHSTILGPDFVVGALYSGMAAVIVAIAVFRRAFGLGAVITREHFMKLGFLLVVFGILYSYFMVNEYLGAGYVGPTAEDEHLRELLHGRFATAFWAMAGIGLIVPVGLLLIPRFRTVRWIVAAAVLVNVGMWLKRYIIIVPTLATPFMPPELGKSLVYRPTWVEWSITVGAFSMFALLYLGFARLFPVVSLWELAEGPQSAQAKGGQAEHKHVGAAPAAVGTARALVVTLATIVVGFGVASRARAQQPATTETKAAPLASVALSVVTEDNRRMIVATVKREEKPVEGAKVLFRVRRTFGNLALGEETTLDDGTAAVPFPEGLPGDAAGALIVIGEVTAPAELALSRAEQSLSGGTPAARESGGMPRALWAPRAPLGFIVAVGSIVGVVWLSYLFVLSLLWRIWKGRVIS
ncbi:MAG: NrfD/PsrC family molybdoenzyme membrane anchor subunit, partial [Phycisphaerales bacterium]|jgi:molybdopterin-containing oxidoreductase family membrane subunit